MSAPTEDTFTDALLREIDALGRSMGGDPAEWAEIAGLADKACLRILSAESVRTGRSVEDLEREALENVRTFLDARIAAEEAVGR